jgi:hypothetical protein
MQGQPWNGAGVSASTARRPRSRLAMQGQPWIAAPTDRRSLTPLLTRYRSHGPPPELPRVCIHHMYRTRIRQKGPECPARFNPCNPPR